MVIRPSIQLLRLRLKKSRIPFRSGLLNGRFLLLGELEKGLMSTCAPAKVTASFSSRSDENRRVSS